MHLTRLIGGICLLALLPFGSTAQAEEPEFHGTSEKYADSGHKGGTGRSGGTDVSVLALIGKAGVTQFAVTATGGTLTKVQLKTTDDAGLTETTNYHASGTTFSFTRSDMSAGQEFQIQANIRADKRMGVVTVSDTVRLYPDLFAAGLNGPDKSHPGAYVEFSLVIGERNGEIGGHGDCNLVIDGATVDAAADVWVNAGDQVICKLSHTFTTIGTYRVQGVVSGVRPGDYDETNNSAETLIEILNNTSPISYSAGYRDYETDHYYREAYTQLKKTSVATYTTSTSKEISNQGWIQTSYMSLTFPKWFTVPLVDVSVREFADNENILSLDAVAVTPKVPAIWLHGLNQWCAKSYFNQITITVCTDYAWRTGAFTTSVKYAREASDIVYHSASTTEVLSQYTSGTTVWYRTSTSTNRTYLFGERLPVGDTHRVEMIVQGGERFFFAGPSMAISRYTDAVNREWGCRPYYRGDLTSATLCAESHTLTHYAIGGVSGKSAY